MTHEGDWLVDYYLLFIPCPVPEQDVGEQGGWSTTARGVLRSSRPLRDTGPGDSIRRLQESLGEGGVAKKSSSILSCLIFHLLAYKPYLGRKPKTGGRAVAGKVSSKAGGLFPREVRHPTVPASRWCLLQVKSLVFSEGLWLGLGSPVEKSQLSQSVDGGPLLAASSRLCPSISPILFRIRLCQGRVCPAVTGIWAVQVGGVVRR